MVTGKTITVSTSDLAEFERVGQEFLEQLSKIFSGSKKILILGYLIGEVEANIKEHSQAENATYTLFPPTGEFWLEDDGIGIGGSFRKSGKKVDDQKALELALAGATTKKGYRGYGLQTLTALVRSLYGRVQISSGKAQKVIGSDWEVNGPIEEYMGTKVIFSLPKKLEITDQVFYNIVEGKT